MKTIQQLIFDNAEELVNVCRWAPVVLKKIALEGKKGDGWAHISYREWEEQGVNSWSLWKTLKWAREKGILLEKCEPPNDTPIGKGRGKKRKAIKLRVSPD